MTVSLSRPILSTLELVAIVVVVVAVIVVGGIGGFILYEERKYLLNPHLLQHNNYLH